MRCQPVAACCKAHPVFTKNKWDAAQLVPPMPVGANYLASGHPMWALGKMSRHLMIWPPSQAPSCQTSWCHRMGTMATSP